MRWLVVAQCRCGNQGVGAEIHQELNKGFLMTENQGFVKEEKQTSRQEEPEEGKWMAPGEALEPFPFVDQKQ
jgi:hypothetical protein